MKGSSSTMVNDGRAATVQNINLRLYGPFGNVPMTVVLSMTGIRYVVPDLMYACRQMGTDTRCTVNVEAILIAAPRPPHHKSMG
jgi:hypothetical protein